MLVLISRVQRWCVFSNGSTTASGAWCAILVSLGSATTPASSRVSTLAPSPAVTPRTRRVRQAPSRETWATTRRSKRTPIDSSNGMPSGLANRSAQFALAREKLSQGRSLLGFFHQHGRRGSCQYGHRYDPQRAG